MGSVHLPSFAGNILRCLPANHLGGSARAADHGEYGRRIRRANEGRPRHDMGSGSLYQAAAGDEDVDVIRGNIQSTVIRKQYHQLEYRVRF